MQQDGQGILLILLRGLECCWRLQKWLGVLSAAVFCDVDVDFYYIWEGQAKLQHANVSAWKEVVCARPL